MSISRFVFKSFIILIMPSVEKLKKSSDLLVSFARLLGKELPLFNRFHWFAKKGIKKFSFLFEVFYKFIFMKQRKGIQRISYYLESF